MSHTLQCVILSAVSTVGVDFATSASRYPTMGLSLIRRSFWPRDIMDLVWAIISAGCIFQNFNPYFNFLVNVTRRRAMANISYWYVSTVPAHIVPGIRLRSMRDIGYRWKTFLYINWTCKKVISIEAWMRRGIAACNVVYGSSACSCRSMQEVGR